MAFFFLVRREPFAYVSFCFFVFEKSLLRKKHPVKVYHRGDIFPKKSPLPSILGPIKKPAPEDWLSGE